MADNTFVNIGGHKVSAGKKYSTTEVKTGDVWIDGKPIYRKVFTGTSPATAYSYVSNFITITNVGYIVNFFGEVGNQPINSIRPASDSTINARYTAWITRNGSTGLDGVFGSSAVNTLYTITIEYTKTTD